jgi:hypothetical protein
VGAVTGSMIDDQLGELEFQGKKVVWIPSYCRTFFFVRSVPLLLRRSKRVRIMMTIVSKDLP